MQKARHYSIAEAAVGSRRDNHRHLSPDSSPDNLSSAADRSVVPVLVEDNQKGVVAVGTQMVVAADTQMVVAADIQMVVAADIQRVVAAGIQMVVAADIQRVVAADIQRVAEDRRPAVELDSRPLADIHLEAVVVDCKLASVVPEQDQC